MDDLYVTIPMVYSDGLAKMLLALSMLVVIKIASKLLSWLDHILPFF
jgi:hypothetical protein